MRKLFYSRVAGRNVHLPKMVGAFIIVATILMFAQSASSLFDARDVMVYYQTCITDLGKTADILQQHSQFEFCSNQLYNATGLVVRADSPMLTYRQFFIGLSGKLAALLFWLAVLIAGYFLYRSDRLLAPIESAVSVPAAEEKKFAFRKKKIA